MKNFAWFSLGLLGLVSAITVIGTSIGRVVMAVKALPLIDKTLDTGVKYLNVCDKMVDSLTEDIITD